MFCSFLDFILTPPQANAEYIRLADNCIQVPGGSNNHNYANVDLILDIAKRLSVQVYIIIHMCMQPGWTVISETYCTLSWSDDLLGYCFVVW